MRPATPDVIAAAAATLRAAGCVFAEDEASILAAAAPTRADLDAMVDRRASGVPVEHVVGWAEFCGLRIAVRPGVFVPRRRSELLVRQAIAAAREPGTGRDRSDGSGAIVTSRPHNGRGCHSDAGVNPPDPDQAMRPVIVDVCCGSGAIGVAVVAGLGNAELHASDIEAAAVACASQNVATVGGHVYQGDLYEPLPAALHGRVDVLVVNAPYVPTAEIGMMPPEARLYEPAIALDGGIDGVAVHRRVAVEAAAWLAPAGRLLIETSERQAALTAAAMRAGGLVPAVTTDDDLAATVVAGSPPAA